MTIIFQKGDEFWIETFARSRVSVAAGSSSGTTFTLERAGTFLGGQATIDAPTGALETGLVGASIRTTGGLQIVLGDEITSFIAIRFNGDASALNLGAYVTMYMRGAKAKV